MLHRQQKNFTVTCKASEKHETGFEPATLALARRYSTTEPLAHNIICLSGSINKPVNEKYSIIIHAQWQALFCNFFNFYSGPAPLIL